MNRGVTAIGSAAMLAAAFAIGRATAPGPVVKTSARFVPHVAAAEWPDAPSDDSLQECKRRLAFAQGVLEAKEQPPYEGPVPFPDELGPQFRAEGFEKAVNDVLRSCPDRGLRVANVDCSEYPCMAFFTQPEGSMNHVADELRKCDAWKKTFGLTGGTANASFMTDDGVVEYSMLSANPYDPDDPAPYDQNAGKRFMDRVEQGKQRLMAELGGREYTPLEQIDQQIAFFEKANDATLADLEEQRAKMIEEQNADPE